MHQYACLPVQRAILLASIGLLAGVTIARAQQQYDSTDHRATEVYTPVPPIVTPGAQCGDAPSDAVILFNDGKNEDEWVKVSDGSPADVESRATMAS